MLKVIKNQINLKYFKNNVLFFLSACCFFLLIFQFAKVQLLSSLIVMLAAVAFSVCFKSVFAQFIKNKSLIKIISAVSALIVSFFSARKFIISWLPSSAIERLAAKIHLTNTIFLTFIASVLALLSLLFLTLILNIVFIEVIKIIKETIQVTNKKCLVKNIKSNILLIISGFAFMGLNMQFTVIGIISILASYLTIIFIFSQVQRSDIFSNVKKMHISIKLYSLISTIGICYYTWSLFSNTVSLSLLEQIGENSFLIRAVTIPLALLSSVVIFVLVALLLNYVAERLKVMFSTLSRAELIVYALITLSLLIFVSFVFFNSGAFWGENTSLDTIYTSDSSSLVGRNVYLRLYHPENDLRQPLFTVFAAPFVGFGYTLSLPLSIIDPVFTPLFMNVVQIAMLVVANLMLAYLLNLNTISRICFMFMSTATYSTLLFSVMMEQYIVAYFWVVFVVYSYIVSKKASALSLSAAGGTLLTSLILIPTTYKKEKAISGNELSFFITLIEKTALSFLMLLLVFGRIDVVLSLSSKTTQLSNFAGGESIVGRINQYVSFVSSCFFAPQAIVDTTTYEHISWQLSNNIVSNINLIGIVILVLCLVSFLVNRKNIMSKISILWVTFSALLLCVVGWGSAENGMILYSLYFGWAFVVLIFQLLEWLSKKLKLKFITPIISCLIVVTLLLFNYQGFRNLLTFAFTYYPR